MAHPRATLKEMAAFFGVQPSTLWNVRRSDEFRARLKEREEEIGIKLFAELSERLDSFAETVVDEMQTRVLTDPQNVTFDELNRALATATKLGSPAGVLRAAQGAPLPAVEMDVILKARMSMAYVGGAQSVPGEMSVVPSVPAREPIDLCPEPPDD